MTNTYKPYPAYKDSGVEWVGSIPQNWGVKPLFSTTISKAVKNSKGSENNVLSLSYGNIVRRDVETNFGLLPESFNTYQIVNPGDIILRLTDLQNDKRSLRVGRASEKGIITSAYLKLSAKKAQLEDLFLYRLLHSYDTTKVFYGMGGGLRQSMKFEDMKRLPLLIPPLEEQTQIANFLDHETARIDTLIAKQQTLIALLKEKRQAVISHAVTKGLNPDVEMKDSGVEWLGEVPAHWDVVQIRRVLIKMEQGKSPECMNEPAADNQWGVLKTSCVNNAVFDLNQNKALPPHIKPFPEYEVKTGDLLMSRASGSVNLIGSVALVENTPSKILLSDKIFRLYLSNIIENRYFSLLMTSFYMRECIKQSISGAEGMANNITKSSIMAFKIPLPPKSEQLTINNYLVSKISKIDNLITRGQQQKLLLKERRTALISAAVTGKIDLRDWQAPQGET